MNIRMLVGLSGNEYSLSPGDTREFPDAEAIRLIDAGFAIPVVEQPIERAVKAPAPERRGKRGRDVVPTEGENTGE
ncbi:hypothetical protein GB928_004245 [Shinella curvata]|uniref:Uncharacterized protein n=1 Tax=Shinella curvata TaxID=1817964 RepID=A0ABT8X9H0_9HYPH|nr:hypothetical protein [Shinella curvata]MCJ8051666.1 hypothetical protein [Shinella curvata]MDO6120386.1 hypothetical protein [Shinella curvata]